MANRILSQAERDALESLIDASSLGSVLDALAHIALEKSEHVEVNWQDSKTAAAWSRASRIATKAAVSLNGL